VLNLRRILFQDSMKPPDSKDDVNEIIRFPVAF
jgi:hypothetical protein